MALRGAHERLVRTRRFLRTDPHGVGCAQAVEMVHIYAGLTSAGAAAEARYPGVAAHLRACGPCGGDFEGLLAAPRPLFFSSPDAKSEILNAGAPASDRDAMVSGYAGSPVPPPASPGLSDPDAHAEQAEMAFLPDVVTYRPGQPATFQPGSGNGRVLDDNAFDIAVAVLAGSALGEDSVPHPRHPEVPLPVCTPAS